ncbi:MAG TPA: vWA domain-containing protein [Ktedonobacteraceae bacterium]
MFTRGIWLSLSILLLSCHSLFLAGNILALQTQETTGQRAMASQASCAVAPAPDARALLIVLLDRSSSLAQTDPEEYSTSVTRILADLWPGHMAVIFFSGSSQPLLQSGPVDLTQTGARTSLQRQIEAQKNMLHGNTPTQYAVEQATSLLAQNGYPAGSEVMLITDGQPFLPADQDGNKQITTIEQKDAPAFCTHGIPINTFGLGNQVPSYTQTFLRTVAGETGGRYQDVTDPMQLAQPVLQLYASWQHLAFVATGSKHQFLVDTYARQVDFIAFLKNSQAFPVTLLGPNQQPVPDQELLNQGGDKHYQFEQMVLQQFNPAGTYTIQTGDPSVQTYVLEETRLHVALLSPVPHASFSAGKPLTVSVAFFDDNNPTQHIHPTSQESVTVGLTYTLQKAGKIVVKGEKTLHQQAPPDDDLFSTQITLPSAGSLTLAISATYQYVPVPAIPEISVQITNAPVSSCVGTASPCQSGAAPLFIVGMAFLTLLFLLLLFFFVWRRPAPFGFLENSQQRGQVQVLGKHRTLKNRLLHPSTISTEELTGFDFQDAHFRLRFQRGRRLVLVMDRNTPSLSVWCVQKPAGQQMQPVSLGSPVRLHEQDRILVHGVPCAMFHLDSPS